MKRATLDDDDLSSIAISKRHKDSVDVDDMNKTKSVVKKAVEDDIDIVTGLQLDSIKLSKLLIGYLRIHFQEYNIFQSPNDVATILFKLFFIKWKWDFVFYPYTVKKLLCYENDGITITAKGDQYPSENSGFFGIESIPMRPNTGIYTIKIKINAIRGIIWDGIGLCAMSLTQLSQTFKDCEAYEIPDFNSLYDKNNYILWHSTDMDYRAFPNGFYVGYSVDVEPELIYNGHAINNDSIFIKNGYEYKSNNQYYKNALPMLKSGDIIILSYDSDNNILYFKKENDDRLDSYIQNLPKNMDMRWLVAHQDDKISMTILN